MKRCGFVEVVIDSPWKRAQVLRKHPRLANLKSIRLGRPPPSRFWRYHSEGTGLSSLGALKSASGCVSTVEAHSTLRSLSEVLSEAMAALAREVVPSEELSDPFLFFFAGGL